MTMARMLILTFSGLSFVTFTWAMLMHFRSVGPMPLGMRFIGAVSAVTMAAFIWSVLAMPLSKFWLAAPILSLASLTLFAWTIRTTRSAGFAVAFAEVQTSAITINGPFRYVRHPFYTSYIIFWLATGFATTSSVYWFGPTVLLACYIVAARREEQLMSRSDLGAEYARYASRTGMFLPQRSG